MGDTMENVLDFEIYEILHLADTDIPTQVFVRVFGCIEDKTIDVDFECICPPTMNTYDEVAEYVYKLVQDTYIKVEETAIEDLIKARYLMNIEGMN